MKWKGSALFLGLVLVLALAAAVGISCGNNPPPSSYCAAGCPSEWVGDGECDNECYSATCNYDGGDCSHLECTTGCPSSWIGDGECDTVCNIAACNYDGGDCSTSQPTATQVSSYCTCPASWLGDNMCDAACNNAVCNYDNGDCSSDSAQLSFSNGGITLTAATSESGGTKTTTITDSTGATLLTSELTINGVRLIFPGVANPTDITFTEPLDALPTNYAAGMAAAYVAGQLQFYESGLMQDNPGCDWFPDTQCTLGCCADHDRCFDENQCSASSWIWGFGSAECKNCNSIVYNCINNACQDVSPVRAYDTCYDNRCHQYYDCPPIIQEVESNDGMFHTTIEVPNCECTSPCDAVSPSTCGNGDCEQGETSENCPGDCVDGGAVSECCQSSGDCPSEELYSCPGSCCCCGAGYICNYTTHRCATSR